MSYSDVESIKARINTGLTDDQIEAFLDDAEIMMDSHGWTVAIQEDLDDPGDELATIHTYLTAHLIEIAEPEIRSDQVQNLSVTFSRPTKQLGEWLKNTNPGRTLARLLSTFGLGEEPDRTAPKTFR